MAARRWATAAAAVATTAVCVSGGMPPGSYDRCVELGPLDVDQARTFIFEWSIDADTLSVGFHARALRGYVGVGFTASDGQAQVIGGTPDDDTPCVRGMYDSLTLYDMYGEAYSNNPEITDYYVHDDDGWYSHVHFNRSLRVGTSADPAAEALKMTLLWAYRHAAVIGGTCQDFASVAADTERAAFTLDLADAADDYAHPVPGGRKEFGEGETRCKHFAPGSLSGAPIEPEGLLSGERHQSHRVAILLIGAGVSTDSDFILQSGAAPPVFDTASGYVRLGEDGNTVCQASTDLLFVEWSGFSDPIGGIESYAITVMSEGGAGQEIMLLDTLDVGAETAINFTISDLRLVKDRDMWLIITGYNPAGRHTSTTSPRVRMLDGTNPLNATLHMAEDGNAQAAFWTEADFFAGWWEGFKVYDKDTYNAGTQAWEPGGYEYAIGTVEEGVANATKLVGWTAESGTAFRVEGLNLTHGLRVWYSVRTGNCAGRETRIATYSVDDPGVNGIVVDLYPPTAGVVYDGPNTFDDSATAEVKEPVSASWAGFLDAPAGLDRYEWAVGTSLNNATAAYTDILAWTDVGLAIAADTGDQLGDDLRNPPFSLSLGDVIYVHVKAVDNAGHVRIVSSNGASLIYTPPP